MGTLWTLRHRADKWPDTGWIFPCVICWSPTARRVTVPRSVTYVSACKNCNLSPKVALYLIDTYSRQLRQVPIH